MHCTDCSQPIGQCECSPWGGRRTREPIAPAAPRAAQPVQADQQAQALPDERVKFEQWFEKRGVWPRLTYEEVFCAGLRAALPAAQPAKADQQKCEACGQLYSPDCAFCKDISSPLRQADPGSGNTPYDEGPFTIAQPVEPVAAVGMKGGE